MRSFRATSWFVIARATGSAATSSAVATMKATRFVTITNAAAHAIAMSAINTPVDCAPTTPTASAESSKISPAAALEDQRGGDCDQQKDAAQSRLAAECQKPRGRQVVRGVSSGERERRRERDRAVVECDLVCADEAREHADAVGSAGDGDEECERAKRVSCQCWSLGELEGHQRGHCVQCCDHDSRVAYLRDRRPSRRRTRTRVPRRR